MSGELVHFDITEYLDSEEAMAEYLSQLLEDGDNEEFLRAISHIAKAKGMAQMAKETGLAEKASIKCFAPMPNLDLISS